MRISLKVFGIIILLTSYTISDDFTKEKRKDINILLEMTGGYRIGEQFAINIIEEMRRTLNEKKESVPDSVIIIAEKTINEIINEQMNKQGGLIDSLQKVYNKYFTHIEIKSLIKFYKTDIGQKYIMVSNDLTKDISIISQEWQQETAIFMIDELMIRLKKKGINF